MLKGKAIGSAQVYVRVGVLVCMREMEREGERACIGVLLRVGVCLHMYGAVWGGY